MSSTNPSKSIDEVAVAGPRDAGNWAEVVSQLHVAQELPPEAKNLNVEGRRLSGPTHGFGKLWKKTYAISLGSDVDPKEVIKTWKQEFPSFWPKKSWFYGPVAGLAPGGVGLINITVPGRLKVSTGVLVLYADDESFTFITPEGHQYAGLITFSALKRDAETFAQVEVLIRASDPLWELGMPIAINRMEDKFWKYTLTSLASRFHATGEVRMEVACVDAKRQWARWRNVKHNSLVRSALYAFATPIRAFRKPAPS
ncbi:MAG: hypothetical protein M3198_11955 [Actinomycetota bacterium]|nr:hypothetical protein [Actinomycetota bacterium]